MKTYTKEEYENMIGDINFGVLFKKKNNWHKPHKHYYLCCDCIRWFIEKHLAAYEDCKICLGRGVLPIPVIELWGKEKLNEI